MRRRWTLWLLIGGLILCIATFPLRLALALADAGAAGLSARGVTGSIWSGRISDTVWRGAELGTLDAGLDPASLLTGSVRMNIAREDVLRGSLGGALLLAGGQGIADVSGAVSLGASLAGVPLDRLQLNGVTAIFDGLGRCTEAAGTLQLALVLPVPGLDLANGLSGPLACRDGRAEAVLASQSGMETLQLAVDGRGAWRARLAVAAGSEPSLSALLRTAGFVPDGDRLILVRSGQL
jgi:general secretion pathway protein N